MSFVELLTNRLPPYSSFEKVVRCLAGKRPEIFDKMRLVEITGVVGHFCEARRSGVVIDQVF
jgi:hypothetical protein